MKRIFSILLTLTLLAGLTAIPAFASTDAEDIAVSADGPVYYYNEFTASDNNSFLGAGSTATGTVDNGVFKFTFGTFKLNTVEDITTSSNASNIKTKGGIEVNYEEGKKPDICVEYKVNVDDLTGTLYSTSSKMFYSNASYGMESLYILNGAILADKNTKTGKMPIMTGSFNNTSHTIKIYYSATQNIRTIFIDNVYYGTFNNVETAFNWSTSTDKKFDFAFQRNGKTTNLDTFEIDYVKVYKVDEEMISLPLTVDADISITEGSSESLWIPAGKKVKLNLGVAEGKTYSVILNKDTDNEKTYIDSFTSDYSYTTPSLSENDTITILANDAVTVPNEETSAITKPYVFQYKKEDGSTAIILLGKYDVIDGYTVSSKGMFISKSNPDVTVAVGEDYYLCNIDSTNDNKIKDGNFAIELINSNWKTGDVIYYKTYVNYKQGDDYSLRVYGAPLSYTIRDDE